METLSKTMGRTIERQEADETEMKRKERH